MTAVLERLAERATEVGAPLSAAQSAQLAAYFELLRRWNPRINLTSLALDALTPADFDRLLIEPIAAAVAVSESAATWFDLGSGGGSPAIPLKVVRPPLRLTMVEARSRKCAFLREAIRTVGLASAHVFQGRIEDLPASVLPGSVDLLTSRALTIDESVHDVCVHLLSDTGRVAVFGAAGQPEVGGERLILLRSLELHTHSRAWLHVYVKVG